jgi:two-component system chemotaxis response regulator CheB
MGKIRVLIVHEDVVARRLAAGVLGADPALAVVGTAPGGRIALAKVPRANPDVVVLDVAAPGADGQDTLAALRKAYPLLPVVLFGAAHRPEADVREGARRLREDLVPRVKQSYARFAGPDRAAAPRPVEVVAVGASTGGPPALAAVLGPLPLNCPVPIVVVQHVLPGFTAFVAERLAAQVRIGASQARAGEAIRPGHAWVAPGGQHMELVRGAEAVRVRLQQGPPENSCRPSVDVLFRSVAEAYGPGALAVVLTGMGKDGLRGCEAVRAAGGQVLVQDEASSVVWGMPGAVARAGLADAVLPLDGLAPEIIRRLRRGRSLSSPG